TILFVLTWFIAGFCTIAQQKEIKGLVNGDIDGCEIVRDENYDGGSLWGLINGGADVYLEYGFKNLVFQEVKKDNNNFRIEIYCMNNAESAFGIYSISCFKCEKRNSISGFDCLNQYQLQALNGIMYISIINETGSSEDQEFSKIIAKKIIDKNGIKEFDYPDFFKNAVFSKYLERIKHFNGTLGIQNGNPLMTDRFENFSDYKYYSLFIGDNFKLSHIEFQSENEVNTFLKSVLGNYNGEQFGYSETNESENQIFKKLNDKLFVFVEYNKGKDVSDKFIQNVEDILSDGKN
ncbi:DUF6599 family protein, partial [Bacteroidota bacterium]